MFIGRLIGGGDVVEVRSVGDGLNASKRRRHQAVLSQGDPSSVRVTRHDAKMSTRQGSSATSRHALYGVSMHRSGTRCLDTSSGTRLLWTVNDALESVVVQFCTIPVHRSVSHVNELRTHL